MHGSVDCAMHVCKILAMQVGERKQALSPDYIYPNKHYVLPVAIVHFVINVAESSSIGCRVGSLLRTYSAVQDKVKPCTTRHVFLA